MVETTEPREPWVHSADPDAGPCPTCGHKDGGIVVGGETRPHTCCGHPDCMTPEATARADAQASLARLAEAEALAATEPSGDDRDNGTCWRCEGKGWVPNGDIDDGRMTGRDTCSTCDGCGAVTLTLLTAEIDRITNIWKGAKGWLRTRTAVNA